MSVDGVVGNGPCNAAGVQRERNGPITMPEHGRRAKKCSPVEGESCERVVSVRVQRRVVDGSPRTA